MLCYDAYVQTHRGLVRTRNEDRAYVVDKVVSADDMTYAGRVSVPADRSASFVVSDGMGGHPGGDVAAQIVATSLGEGLMARVTDLGDLFTSVLECMGRISAKDPSLSGFGATAAALAVTGDQAQWFNVGDSRVYRYRQGYLAQLSLDHTLAPESPILTEYFGGDQERVPDAWEGTETVLPGMSYLLCSDGITCHLSHAEIAAALAQGGAGAVEGLMAEALRRGGHDNITLVLVEAHETMQEGDHP